MTRQQSLFSQQSLKGFTLVELLLAIAIAGTVLGVAAELLQHSYEARTKATAVTEVELQGADALRRITQVVRNAKSLTMPAPGTNSSTLTVTVADSAKSPTTVALSGSTLTLTEGISPAVALTSSRVETSNFTVTNLGHPGTPGSVRIQFTLSAHNPNGRNEFRYTANFTGSASLR